MSFNFLANQDPFDQKSQTYKGTFDKFLEIQQNGQNNIHNFTLSSKFPGPSWMSQVGVWLASQKFWPKYFELKLNQYFDGTASIDQVIALFEAMFFEGQVEIGGETKTILQHYLDFTKVIDKSAYERFIKFLGNKFGEFEVMNFETGGIVNLRDIRTNLIYKVEQNEKVFLKKDTILLTRIYKSDTLWHFTEGFVAAKFKEKADSEKANLNLELLQLDSIFNFYKLQELQDKLDTIRNLNYEELLNLLKRKTLEYGVSINFILLEKDIKTTKTRANFIKKYSQKFHAKNISLQEIIILEAVFHFLYTNFPARLTMIRSKFFKESFMQKLVQLPESLQQSFAEFGIEISDKNFSQLEFIKLSRNSKVADIFAKTANETEYEKYFKNLHPVSQIQVITNHLRENQNSEFRSFLFNKLKSYLKDFPCFTLQISQIDNILQNLSIENKIKPDANSNELTSDKLNLKSRTKQTVEISNQILSKAIALMSIPEDKCEIKLENFINKIKQVLTIAFENQEKTDLTEIISQVFLDNSEFSTEEIKIILTKFELIFENRKIQISTFGKLLIFENYNKSEVISQFLKIFLLQNEIEINQIYKIFIQLVGQNLTVEQIEKQNNFKTKLQKAKFEKLVEDLILYGILEDVEEKLKLSSFGNIILMSINQELLSLLPIGLIELLKLS